MRILNTLPYRAYPALALLLLALSLPCHHRGKHCANATYFDTNFEHPTFQGFASYSVALGYVASVSKSPYIMRAPAGAKSLAKNNLRDFYHVFLGDATLLILFWVCDTYRTALRYLSNGTAIPIERHRDSYRTAPPYTTFRNQPNFGRAPAAPQGIVKEYLMGAICTGFFQNDGRLLDNRNQKVGKRGRSL